jgi:NADH:ubiquinone reductase (H+-translocating)
MTMARHRVAIVGGGFGGLFAARALRREDVEVTIIDRPAAGDTTPRPFRYRDLGTMATISRFRALAAFGRIRAVGFGVWLVWLVVHVVGLTGFKSRFAVLFNWTIAFLGRGLPQRVITAQ